VAPAGAGGPLARLRDVALGAGDDRGGPGGGGARGDGGDPPGAGQGAVGRSAGAGLRRVPAVDAAPCALVRAASVSEPARLTRSLTLAALIVFLPVLPASVANRPSRAGSATGPRAACRPSDSAHSSSSRSPRR